MHPVVYFSDLGLLTYNEAWRLQERLQHKLIEKKRTGQNPDKHSAGNSSGFGAEPKSLPSGYLLFLEHPHVYTIGKSGNWENLLFTDDILKQRGIEVVKTDRGGDITYHGPGQLVGYPVLDLELFNMGIAAYIERLEEIIIRTAAHFGITARRVPSRTGVWVNNNKLCAIGIKCSRYVCMHGFALNIQTDLDFYHGIIPCGISDGGVTSFHELLDKPPAKKMIADRLIEEFRELFGCTIIQKDPEELIP
ncbi:MAG: lipoyl(octanoyl) transferase LipB [Cyclonatronaceae bacterium]